MDDINKFYAVVLDSGRRMTPCAHKHLTQEEAQKCADDHGGVSIIEWIKDRRPQFQEVWRRPDLKPS